MKRKLYPVKRILFLEKKNTSKGTVRVRLVERDCPQDKEKLKGYLNIGYGIIKEVMK